MGWGTLDQIVLQDGALTLPFWEGVVYHGTEVLGRSLYLVGGNKGSANMRSSWSLDLDTFQWDRIAPMRQSSRMPFPPKFVSGLLRPIMNPMRRMKTTGIVIRFRIPLGWNRLI